MKIFLALIFVGIFVGGYFVFNKEPRRSLSEVGETTLPQTAELSQDQKVALDMAKFLEKDGAKLGLTQASDQPLAQVMEKPAAKSFEDIARLSQAVEETYAKYEGVFGKDPESRALHEITALGTANAEGADLAERVEAAQAAYDKLYEKPVESLRSAADAFKALPQGAQSERMALIQTIERLGERSPEARAAAREILVDVASGKETVSETEPATRGQALSALRRFGADAAGRSPAAEEIERNVNDPDALEWAKLQGVLNGGTPNVESKPDR